MSRGGAAGEESIVSDAELWQEAGPADRCYQVPFRAVWQGALKLVDGERGWTLVSHDPGRGAIEAELRTPLRRTPRRVHFRLWLDAAGMTRLETLTASPDGRMQPGARWRAVRHLLGRLDRLLATGRA